MQYRPHIDAPPPPARAATPRRIAALATLLGLALGCASSDEKPTEAEGDPQGTPVENTIEEPMKWNDELNRDNRKIGFILAEIDRSIRIWNDLVLAGKTARDAHSVKLIEEAIAHDTSLGKTGRSDPIIPQIPRFRNDPADPRDPENGDVRYYVRPQKDGHAERRGVPERPAARGAEYPT
jgi:hypothetical protein